ncbi:hypothetical protein ACOJBM_35465 [Rhizobium beringeri]
MGDKAASAEMSGAKPRGASWSTFTFVVSEPSKVIDPELDGTRPLIVLKTWFFLIH